MTNQDPELYLLPNGLVVPRKLYDFVREHIAEIVPAMQRDVGYTVKDIFDAQVWSHWSHGTRRLVGRCVSYMVSSNVLPLERLGCRHDDPARYRPR